MRATIRRSELIKDEFIRSTNGFGDLFTYSLKIKSKVLIDLSKVCTIRFICNSNKNLHEI